MHLELDNQDEISALTREISSWLTEAQSVGHPSNSNLKTTPPGEIPPCVQRLIELISSQTEDISKQVCKKWQSGILIRSKAN
jgi:hypothetical protein